ncbi:hypothetical protein LT493_15730 [Streptomyces tricolor]|nr:hypothetical protein [Streptomyces tricolor]
MLSLTGRALAAPDAVTADARRLTRAGEQKIRMGASTLIGTVAPRPRAARGRHANPRDALRAGGLDIIVIPAVAAMPCFEHRGVGVEPIVVVGPEAGRAAVASGEEAPPDPAEAGETEFIPCRTPAYLTRGPGVKLGLGS